MSVSAHIPLECSTAVLTTTRHSRPWSATRTVLTATTQRDSNDDDRHSRPPVSYSYSQQQRSYSSSTAMTGDRQERLSIAQVAEAIVDRVEHRSPCLVPEARGHGAVRDLLPDGGVFERTLLTQTRLSQQEKPTDDFYRADRKGGRGRLRGRIGRSGGGRRAWTCRGPRSVRSRGSCSNSPSLAHHGHTPVSRHGNTTRQNLI